MFCYRVKYYFRTPYTRRRLLCGVVCGCVVAANRERAREIISPMEEKGKEIVKVTAKKKEKGHICTAHLEEIVQ